LTDRGEALVQIGTIVGAFGLRGAVKIATVEPDDFIVGMRVIARTAASDVMLTIAGVRATPASFTVSFAGVETAEAVEQLRGASVYVHRNDLPETTPGVYRAHDLLGMAVHDRRLGALGEVRDVRRYPQCDMLFVGEHMLLVPMLRAYGVVVDAVNRTIATDLPAGFDEL
jgi:16S rRNA processing protein RimM